MTEKTHPTIPYSVRVALAGRAGCDVKTITKAAAGHPIRGAAGLRARAALVEYAAELAAAAADLSREPGEGQA